MATKKNNTKKENNKPETKEEIVEIIEREIEEVVEETTEQHDEAIRDYLKTKGMDDKSIEHVLLNEELKTFVTALMAAEQKPENFFQKGWKKTKQIASDKKEVIKTSAIVVAATAAVTGVVYVVCNVGDDDIEEDVPLNMEPGDNALYIHDLRDDEVEEITDYLAERGFTKKDPEEVFNGDNNANEAEEA